MLNKQEMSHFQKILDEQKRDLEERFEQNDNLDLKHGHYHESVGELSSYDNHPGDEGTELFEREKDIALAEHYHHEYMGVLHALKAIEEGTYGKCTECSQDIPIERLEVIPTTLYCKEHSPDQKISDNRPVEEEILTPPFGKFDMDNKDESVGFDAEDSWQEVASWGTSETPSDFANLVYDDYNDVYTESNENIGYVEDYENFVGVDIEGKNITIYPNEQHKRYEQSLDEEGIMTTFGDLPAYEHEPYVENND